MWIPGPASIPIDQCRPAGVQIIRTLFAESNDRKFLGYRPGPDAAPDDIEGY